MNGPYRESSGSGAGKPPEELLRLQTTTDLLGLAPRSSGEVFAVLELEGLGKRLEVARARFSVMFVLDTSGSMSGEPLLQVCDSVTKLADLLEPTDSAGVVAFSDNPSEVMALTPLSPSAKAGFRRRVHALTSEGSTRISAGVAAGRALLPPRKDGERQLLLVLTDGQPTDGTTAASFAELARGFRPDVSVVALGYGPKHNAELLRAFADGGGGQYWYIADPAQANMEFARAIGSQGDVVVDGVQLVLAPGPGVEVLEVLGEPRLRFGADGARVSLPDLREGEKRTCVVKLQVQAPREPSRFLVLGITVEHRQAGLAQVRKLQSELTVDITHRQDGLLHVAARVQVLLARAELLRRQARVLCDQQRYDAAAVLLRKMIAELEGVPGYVKLDGGPLSEAVEQLIDEAVVCEQRPSVTAYNEFRAGTLGVDVAQGSKHHADRKTTSALGRSTISSMLDCDVEGVVVIELPGGQLQRVMLAPELSVGRSPGNDVSLALASVARRHCRVVCRHGKVFVYDLGSSNGTLVNGQRVTNAEVQPSDVIQLGDAKLQVLRVK
ncbi:MAG: VWA domain-containing protein [Myxococcales bacterium]|nr:VWA domain-containing protein [Myxococcales bacterium]